MTQIKSKYRTYCSNCHYTIWQNERIEYDGKPHHVDCAKALLDPTQRKMKPEYERMLGKVKKTSLARMLEEHAVAEAPATGASAGRKN